MTKCYGHEECEYNGQPECRLPDGVPCPHGVTADKPAAESGTDIEKLIRKGKSFSRKRESIEDELIQDLTTALSTIQAKKAEMQKQLNEFSEFLCHLIGEMSNENEKMRAELDSVKCERDAAIKDLFEIIGDIEEIRCGYGVDNADTDEAFAELCDGYCANVGNFCYEEGEHYRCKHFKWRGPHKED